MKILHRSSLGMVVAVTCAAWLPVARAQLRTALMSPAPAKVRTIEAEIDETRSDLDIVATTRTARGTFDWVRKESLKVPADAPSAEDLPPVWALLGVPEESLMTPQVREAARQIALDMRGPRGTLPIARPDAETVARHADSYREFMRNIPKPASVNVAPGQWRYYVSLAEASTGTRFVGTAAAINVWRPAVDTVNNADPMSLMQLSMSTVGGDGKLETLEIGWQVLPGRFGDQNSHLFLFQTSDGYGARSCYDGDCVGVAGWIPLSSTIAPGIVLTPSTSTSNQELPIIVVPYLNYYLVWALGEYVGAAPREFYNDNSGTSGLYGGANDVSWYGEVADNEHDGIATGTDMGGGNTLAYVRMMKVIPSGGTARDSTPTSFSVTDSNCYNGIWSNSVGDGSFNTFMFLGGPGSNPNCTSDL